MVWREVWGTCEATAMKTVPCRLIVLGGGSAAVEIAQVGRPLGGEAVLVEGADRLIPREPAPLGTALAEAMKRDGIELHLGLPAAEALQDGNACVVRRSDGAQVRGERLLVRPVVIPVRVTNTGSVAQAQPKIRCRHALECKTHHQRGERKQGGTTWPSSQRPQMGSCLPTLSCQTMSNVLGASTPKCSEAASPSPAPEG